MADEIFLVLPFAAYILFALTNVTDKYLINAGLNPHVVAGTKQLITAAMLLAAILAFAPASFAQITLYGGVALLVVGILGVGAAFYFYRSLKADDISHFIPYYQSSIVFIPFVASVIFLAEIVNVYNVLGVAAIVVGVYITAAKRLEWPRYPKEVHLTTVFNAVQSFFLKVSTIGVYPLVISFVAYLLPGLVLLGRSKNRAAEMRRLCSGRFFGYLIAAALISFLGTSALLFALANLEGSKVFPVSGLYLLSVVLLGGFVLKEGNICRKLAGAVFIVLGIWAVYL